MSSPFNRSVLTYANAQAEVAAAAGASDAPQLARAGNSLDAVAQQWNRKRWKFLLTDQMIGIVAPFTVAGCSTTADSTTVTTTVSNGFLSVLVDDVVAGAGIRSTTLVGATGATALTLAASASATVTDTTLTFSRPLYALATNFKTIFDVRVLGNPQPLFYRPRRLADSQLIDQTSPGTLTEYDLYLVGDRGKIRFLPPPAGAESVAVKYYRRITMPSGTGSSGLDIPEDFEDVFMAAAKAHYLIDKGQPHAAQWSFWNQYAQNGLLEMRRDERVVEDENLVLQPHQPHRIYNPNSPYYGIPGPESANY